jgi:hypothetical protein
VAKQLVISIIDWIRLTHVGGARKYIQCAINPVVLVIGLDPFAKNANPIIMNDANRMKAANFEVISVLGVASCHAHETI